MIQRLGKNNWTFLSNYNICARHLNSVQTENQSHERLWLLWRVTTWCWDESSSDKSSCEECSDQETEEEDPNPVFCNDSGIFDDDIVYGNSHPYLRMPPLTPIGGGGGGKPQVPGPSAAASPSGAPAPALPILIVLSMLMGEGSLTILKFNCFIVLC